MRLIQAWGAACASFLALAAPAGAQTSLDKQAYDLVWDKLESVLPKDTPSENVHALEVIVPATWAKRTDEGLIELQHYAGAIPEEKFSIDPSRVRRELHRVYADFVLDVDLPQPSPGEAAGFAEASARYGRTFDEYKTKLREYLADWNNYATDLERRKQPIDSLARLRFRDQFGGSFVDVENRLDTAMLDMQRYSAPGSQYLAAVRSIREQLKKAQADMVGIIVYEGGFETLEAMKDDCADAGPGWEEISFTSKMTSQKTRTSRWNADGAWSGAFFSLGGRGGSGNFSNIVKTAGDSVVLRFCNLAYIPMRPGAWWDADLLKAIDRGAIPLKAGSPMRGKKAFGASGEIPRMVKGAVVARRVTFLAQLDRTSLDEFRRSSGGGGGLRIGPFRIGGGGNATEFGREYTEQQGKYGRSTAFDVPVILAIITEPTPSVAPAAVPTPSRP